VLCPYCNTINLPDAIRCKQCHGVFGSDQATMAGVTGVLSGAPSQARSRTPVAASGVWLALEPGHVLGERYQIASLLGEGGMGAVYKATDLELDRTVALKVIRPELAANPEMLERFKQELILSRQITHRNVIRIFDLGLAEGLRFITMEFVEGRDLKGLIGDRRPEFGQAVDILRQICLGLECAHAESVIHRDLKPQNIMIDPQGRVAIMDFGLASAMESTGITRTGVLVGTPDYMSPEQALGRKLDTRSDIFSLGMIFYEMLTGVVPFRTNSVVGTLVARTQRAATPAAEVNPKVPAALSEIAARCMAIEPSERFQTVSDAVVALDEWKSGATTSAAVPKIVVEPSAAAVEPPPAPVPVPRGRRSTWMAGAAVLAVLAAGLWYLAGAGVFSSRSQTKRPGLAKPVTVLVADFDNLTGEPIFNGSLEPMFTLALEGAPFISTVRHDQAVRTAQQMQPGVTALSEQLARLVAVRDGIAVVVSGTIRHTSQYEIAVRALDAVTGREIAQKATQTANKEGVLGMIGKLAAPVRIALGDATPESAQMASAETFTAGSLDAAQRYAAAQELRFAGKGEEAVNAYRNVIALDPNFGSAYASLAAMYANLGQREEATSYYKLAMARTGRMTAREKYRTRGGYYLAVMDPEKAIEELSALVKEYPADTMGLSSLAFAHYLRHDMAKAMEEGRRALEIYPRNVPYRNNVALYALYAGEFETSAKEARAVLQQNPSYLKGYITLALAELAQGRAAKAAESYTKLQALSPLGASFAATGLADLALYEGRAEDARSILEQAVAADLENKNPASAAKKLVMAGEALLLLGRKPQALAAVDRAAGMAKQGVLFSAARFYVEAGQESRARSLAAELERRFEPVPQAQAKLILAELELKQGRPREAIKLLDESVKLSDTWLSRFDRGRAFLAAEAFTRADSEFDACLKRRGEATDVLMDEGQTYRVFPAVYYYLGRVREGLNSPGAAESYQMFLGLKGKDARDALIEDARRRIARK
jgi:tetratricopeptide (TPR) repeat protein